MSKKIIFFGNEKLATGISTKAEIFSGLIEANYQIQSLIISQKNSKAIEELEIVKLARKHHIDVRSYNSLKEATDELSKFKIDTAILVAYGKIIPKETLDIFKNGIINIHPSLLPKHRGPTPIESTILNGDKKTGISIIKLDQDMDSGPIYIQQELTLQGHETKQQLADQLDLLAKQLLIANLDGIISGNIQPHDQIGEPSYDKLLSKNDGRINWQDNWITIERKLRAFSNWPRLRFNLSGLDIVILNAHFIQKIGPPGKHVIHEGDLGIFCNDGLVIVDSLLPVGRGTMSGKDFLIGYKNKIF